jgi:hypothetical protein
MSEQVTFEVDDAIVLLLGAPSKFHNLEGRLEGITRLEKLIFLMEKETPLGEKLTEVNRPGFPGDFRTWKSHATLA